MDIFCLKWFATETEYYTSGLSNIPKQQVLIKQQINIDKFNQQATFAFNLLVYLYLYREIPWCHALPQIQLSTLLFVHISQGFSDMGASFCYFIQKFKWLIIVLWPDNNLNGTN